MSEEDNKHLENVNSTLKYSTEQFDKNILYIASGCLGISFAFIKDIIPDLEKATCKKNLINSWYVFASVIFASLVCHYVSMLANRWAIKNNDLEPEDFNKKIEYWNWPIRIINGLMIGAILIGALMLVHFINSNIN